MIHGDKLFGFDPGVVILNGIEVRLVESIPTEEECEASNKIATDAWRAWRGENPDACECCGR